MPDVTFKQVKRPAPNAMFELMAQAMEALIGQQTVTDEAGRTDSAYRHCLRHVRICWENIGGNPGPGSPAWASSAAEAANQMRKYIQKTPPPRGAVILWGATPTNSYGHIAIADGDGNSVNNWGRNKIERTSLKEQGGFLGWVDPSHLGGGKISDADLKNPAAPEYVDPSSEEEVEVGGSKLYFAGNFKKVADAFSGESLRDAVFNPPLPKKWSTGPRSNDPMEEMLRAQQLVNLPGFIVRDPLFRGEDASSSARQTKNKTKQKSDPDAKSSTMFSDSWLTFTTNYGFRFLYNPSTFSEGYTSISDSDPLAYSHDVSGGAQPIVGASGGSLGFNLLLYRKFDVELLRYIDRRGGLESVDTVPIYGEKVHPKLLKKIKERGTLVDIEWLFRLCNGEPQDTWHGRSSDWGAIMPTMVVISMGDAPGARKIRGMLTGVNVTHNLFASGMIPVYTEVQLTISRVVDQYYTPYSDENDPTPDLGASMNVSSASPGVDVTYHDNGYYYPQQEVTVPDRDYGTTGVPPEETGAP